MDRRTNLLFKNQHQEKADFNQGQVGLSGKAIPDGGKVILLLSFFLMITTWHLCQWNLPVLEAGQDHPCIKTLRPEDTFLAAGSDGKILFKRNTFEKRIPASTIKILTAATAIHHLGLSYRFPTEFYKDSSNNLKIKGYGDPLIVSEVLEAISGHLAEKMNSFDDLILDDTHFSSNISIPGCKGSTNPYDAPASALCANFNTINFDRNNKGKAITAESQTPLIPFARDKIDLLGIKKGRFTFTRNSEDAAIYFGKLFLYFLKKRGVEVRGEIRMGQVKSGDRLVYTHKSVFSLEQTLKKMLKFSSNFIANQISISMGALIYGPPGTLEKGTKVIRNFALRVLDLKDIKIVEGSGISRKNRLSAHSMLSILKQFLPHRHLLVKKNGFLYKTGTLQGISARSGYFETEHGDPSYFVIFLNRAGFGMDSLMECAKIILMDEDRGI